MRGDVQTQIAKKKKKKKLSLLEWQPVSMAYVHTGKAGGSCPVPL